MLMQPLARPISPAPAPEVAAAPAAIAFDNISLAFGGEAGPMLALDGVSFTAPQGQITTVVGPSGCGKTTLLRLVAGWLKPSAGRTIYQDREVAGLNVGVGFVTQDSNLFPWATALA